jgi:hypothetical protein
MQSANASAHGFARGGGLEKGSEDGATARDRVSRIRHGFRRPTFQDGDGFRRPTFQDGDGFRRPTFQDGDGFRRP